MVDLATFAENLDSERFEQSMQSARTAGVKPLALSNRGMPKQPLRYLSEIFTYISPGNNAQGLLQYTFGGSYPAASFTGVWKSNSSQVLVKYDFDNPPGEYYTY